MPENGENNGGNEANGANGNGRQSVPPVISPFDWQMVLLGIYLLLALGLSAFLLAGLMLADTTDASKDGATLETCRKSPTPTPTPNANANTNASAANTNANASNTNSSNTNASNAANTTAGAAGSTAAGGTKPPQGPTPTPTATPPNGTNPPEVAYTVPKIVKLESFGYPFSNYGGCLTGDGYVFLIVLFAGMLGASIRVVYSFFLHLGRKDFGLNWAWYYIFLPYFGGTLSLILYMVIRGGFYNGAVGKTLYINVFSFAALGALTGLFSDQALEKLKLVAESLLTKTESKTSQPAIAKINIAPTSITLTATEPTKSLTATAMDAQDKPVLGVTSNRFLWKSDNDTVAKVDESGKVTRVTAGKCSVRATANNNSVVSNNCAVECE